MIGKQNDMPFKIYFILCFSSDYSLFSWEKLKDLKDMVEDEWSTDDGDGGISCCTGFACFLVGVWDGWELFSFDWVLSWRICLRRFYFIVWQLKIKNSNNSNF